MERAAGWEGVPPHRASTPPRLWCPCRSAGARGCRQRHFASNCGAGRAGALLARDRVDCGTAACFNGYFNPAKAPLLASCPPRTHSPARGAAGHCERCARRGRRGRARCPGWHSGSARVDSWQAQAVAGGARRAQGWRSAGHALLGDRTASRSVRQSSRAAPTHRALLTPCASLVSRPCSRRAPVQRQHPSLLRLPPRHRAKRLPPLPPPPPPRQEPSLQAHRQAAAGGGCIREEQSVA